MNTVYNIALVLGVIVAVLFSALVFLTGKGDAMSGSGSIRTSYKGKASFDDIISKVTLGAGILFMALMVLVDALGNRIFK